LSSNSDFKDFSDSIVPYILAIYDFSQITANGFVYDTLRGLSTKVSK
jgi:hypothetical protein